MRKLHPRRNIVSLCTMLPSFFTFIALVLISLNNLANGVFNAEELKSINYEIDILSVPVKAERAVDFPVLHMTSKYGQHYQCQLPEVLTDEDKSEGSGSGEPEIPDINDLLKPMSSAACLLKPKDWWTYEFCYGKFIRQYHIEDSQISGAIITLGIFDMSKSVEKSEAEENSRLEQNRYHSHYYVNGSKCDITGIPRSTEIRFFCEPDSNDYISRVDEPETCHYIVTIQTSRVCSHPHLKPLPSVKPHTIQCNPVLAEEHYAKYLQRVEEEKDKAETKRREWLAEQQKKLEELKARVQERRERHKVFLAQSTKSSDGITLNTDVEETEVENLADDEIRDEEIGDSEFIESLENDLGDLENLFKGKLKESLAEFEASKEKEGTIYKNEDEKLRDVSLAKLANTLNSLIEKVTSKVEKNMLSATEQLEKAKEAVSSFSKKVQQSSDIGDKGSGNEAYNEDETTDELLSLQEDSTENEDKGPSMDDNGKLRVRIRRVNAAEPKSEGKIQWFREKGLDAEQKQKLEDAVKEKLKEAGLDTSGRQIEVKIITAGYYDDEEGKDFHLLSDEETQQFQNMILALLTRNQEARKEMDRQRKLELNYQYKWDEDKAVLDPNDEE